MSRIKNFFTGLATFQVQSLPIVCLNKLRTYQISQIKITGEQITFSAPLAYVKEIKKLLTNFEYKLHENRNIFRGLNFLLNHISLCIVIILALVAFLIADMRIYDIKVVTNDSKLTQAVNEYLASQGVKKFTSKSHIQADYLANHLVTDFSNIAHVNIKISGNTLLVNLSTASSPDQKVKTNICAKYDAVIKKVIYYSGQPLISPGDVIRKGDVLIQDAYEDSVMVIGEVAFVRGEEIVRLDIIIS